MAELQDTGHDIVRRAQRATNAEYGLKPDDTFPARNKRDFYVSMRTNVVIETEVALKVRDAEIKRLTDEVAQLSATLLDTKDEVLGSLDKRVNSARALGSELLIERGVSVEDRKRFDALLSGNGSS